MKKWIILNILFAAGLFSACKYDYKSDRALASHSDWQWGPFNKVDSINPILKPSSEGTFFCPVLKEKVHWQEKDVFNPSAVVKGDSIYMIYRAEDTIGKYAGTSRLGLAYSIDGLHFNTRAKPVLYPDKDFMKIYEWDGGCEDPRVVVSTEGAYFMTYTAWDGHTARLAIASSPDLIHWNKLGLVLGSYKNGKYKNLWSKSGSIITEKVEDKLVASKINGRYWMYWGDSNIYLATSDDLINWEPVEDRQGNLKVIFGPRKNHFDSELVEPGPPALITSDGIWMIYNSKNSAERGTPDLPPGTYSAGQILFDLHHPDSVVARSDKPFFKPENEYEITGQVNNVCFVEAFVPFSHQWFLYYGTADSKIAVAVYNKSMN